MEKPYLNPQKKFRIAESLFKHICTLMTLYSLQERVLPLQKSNISNIMCNVLS